MYCSKCGAQQPDGTKFCTNCGSPLTQTETAEVTRTPAPANASPNPTPVSTHVKKKKKSILKKWWFWVIVVILIARIGTNGSNKDTSSKTNSSSTAKTESVQSSTSSTGSKTGSAAPKEVEVVNSILAANPNEMAIGDIAEYKNAYIGLSHVKTTSTLITAVSGYSVEPTQGSQVLVTFFELYNPSSKTQEFSESSVEVYVDGNKVDGVPDNYYKIEVDGIKQLDSYSLEPGTRAYVVCDFEIPLSYEEVFVYCGNNCIWKLSKSDITSSEFDASKTLYAECDGAPFSPTTANTVIYSDDYELTYLGATNHTESNMFSGDSYYFIFEFSLKNTSDRELDYSLVGYKMRAYLDNVLLEDASYLVDATVDGCINVFNVDSIKSGMSAKFYVAIPTNALTGDVKFVFDQGYISSDVLATVDATIK